MEYLLQIELQAFSDRSILVLVTQMGKVGNLVHSAASWNGHAG